MAIEHPLPATCNLARWAAHYDSIYAARGKRYDREAARLHEIAGSARRSWLDVACGTGEHLKHLDALGHDVTGVDASPPMLEIARAKLPHATFVEADMTTLRLDRRFDVVSCLFASIAYLPDAAAVTRAIARMAAHLEPGGVLIIEPGLTPDQVRPPAADHLTIDLPDATLERTATARREPDTLHIRFDFTLRRGDTIDSFTDEHRIALFPGSVFVDAFRSANLRFDVSTFRPFDVSLHIGFSSIV